MRRCQRGFTLIEIAIAVTLLGLGFATLMSLQSKYIDNQIFEKNLVRAALYGQYIMAMYDIAPRPPEEGGKDGDLADALQDNGYFTNDEQMANSREADLKGWRYQQNVTKIGVPPFDDVLRKIELNISWSNSPRDNFSLTYFIRSKPERGE